MRVKNNQDAKFCANCGSRLALAVETAIKQPEISPITPKFAGFWLPTLAAVIDDVLCSVAQFLLIVIILALVMDVARSETMDLGVYMNWVLMVLIRWLWFTIAESSKWQATVGKRIVGLKVTDENGERIGFVRANVRYWTTAVRLN